MRHMSYMKHASNNWHVCSDSVTTTPARLTSRYQRLLLESLDGRPVGVWLRPACVVRGSANVVHGVQNSPYAHFIAVTLTCPCISL
jgi:hypothetical protein